MGARWDSGDAMIDWARVTELADEIGPDDMDDVMGLFFEEADETLDRLIDGLAPDKTAAALHFLKGSALNLGFSDLARACETGERAVMAGQPPDAPGIAALYAASRAALEQGMAARRAA